MTPAEMHVVWMTAGLSCDGDTIAMTAATQPSLEELVEGVLPGVPRIRLHNPVLAYEVGDEFVAVMHRASSPTTSWRRSSTSSGSPAAPLP